jgi:predicted GNAT family N-acyltransferase
MLCCYALSDIGTRYTTQFEQCGCVEGNRAELISQIESNPQFCGDQTETAISYTYFVSTLKNHTIIYIKNSDNNILGACSIKLGAYIIIGGICVPYDDSIKGIGTILLDKVKCIGELIKARAITLSAKPSVSRFYEKNGFVTDEDEYDEGDFRRGSSTSIKMIYEFEKHPQPVEKEKQHHKKANRRTNNAKSQKRETRENIKNIIDHNFNVINDLFNKTKNKTKNKIKLKKLLYI